MAEEKKKETEESEVKAEGTEQVQGGSVPNAKERASANGGNRWQQGVSSQSTESSQQSQSQTEQVSSKEFDPTLYAKGAEGAEDVYKRTPTAVDMVMPWLKDDLDPEKAAAAKRDANFRKGLHEAVESLRVLSDIGASFAGGNAYKREAPDYKRYEDEKAKIDAARKSALDKLFQAQAADRDYKRSLQNMAFSNSFVGKSNSQTKGEQKGQSQTNGETSQWEYQPVASNRTIINNGDGARDGKPWTSVKIRDEKGNVIGSRRINFKSEADEKSYYASLNKLLVSERDVKVGSPMHQAASSLMNSNKLVSRMMNDKTLSGHERYQYLRTLLNGGEVTYGSGDDAVKIKLTGEEIRNAESSVQLSDQQYRDLLKDLGYNEDDVKYWDDQTAETTAAKDKNAQPVLKDGTAVLD